MIEQWKIDGGIILVDKPLEWTSFDVVKRLRNRLGHRKIGHAGTLDPLATGLLVLCFGRYTKRIEEIQAMGKEYVADIRFGQTTLSYDLETPVEGDYPTDHLNADRIAVALQGFLGEVQQRPPAYSAVKVDGVRAYEYARKGEDPKLRTRSVHIHELEVISWEKPDLRIRIRCGKGTYIRSLAHDLGLSLNSGAHLRALRRTRIGAFDVKNALSPDRFNGEDDFYLHRITL